VIIPCFNQAHFLGRAIRSCVSESLTSFEIIVIDDGSSDDVQSVTAEFGCSVRLITTLHRGASAARNTAMRLASGRFIKFLDADDWLLPGSLARQVSILQQASDSILITGFRYCYAKSGRGEEDHFPDFGFWQGALAHRNTSPIHAFLLPNGIATRIGDFDESLSTFEDYDYWLRAAFLGIRVLVMHSIECVYYRHDTNVSLDQKTMRKGGLAVWKRYAQLVTEHSPSPLINIEFLKSSARHITQHPDDVCLQRIADSLLDSVSPLAKTSGIKDALEIIQAIADLALACRAEEAMKRTESLPLELLDQLHYQFSDFEKHQLQQSLLAIGQRFLQAGRKKIAQGFLRKVQDLDSDYGLNYRLLSRFQQALAAILPGGVAVAVFVTSKMLLESYWKYLKKFIYGLVCLSKSSGD